MISTEQITLCGVLPAEANAFAIPLTNACAKFDIGTPLRIAAFLAQCIHESQEFTMLSEGLYYKNADRIREVFGARCGDLNDCAKLTRNPIALANVVYADRMGNGNVASGDGYRFRGAGLIQLTGRANQTACAHELGKVVDGFGDYLRTPEGASMSAAWFWSVNHINTPADAGDIDGCTRKINPAMMGAALRRALYLRTLKVFA